MNKKGVLMQKFVVVVVLLFLAGGVLLFVLPAQIFPSFYNPTYMAVMAFINAGILAGIEALRRRVPARWRGVVRLLQSLTAFALILNAGGALGLYRLSLVGFHYDGVVHAVNSAFFAFVLARSYKTWRPHVSMWSLFVVVLGTIVVGGLFWEGWEAFSDFAFGTESFGDYGQMTLVDTRQDIILNVLGALFGTLLESFRR